MRAAINLIHTVPGPIVAPVCILIFVVPAILGLWVAHRGIYQRLQVGATLIDNGVVGWFFSGILTIYGITLGLIAISTWESSSEVANVASREAAAIAALYRDATGFPSPLRENLRNKLREYTHFVIEQAWPAQRRGEIIKGGGLLLDDFQRARYANEPQTDSQKILQTEALRKYNELVELRRVRSEAVDHGVPNVIWAVILLGGAITILTSYCFQIPQLRLHMLLTISLAAMIGLLVFLIAAMDQPYRGVVAIEPTAYQLVLENAMAE